MRVFDIPGKTNTNECIAIAIQKAKELDVPIVASSTTGATALSIIQAIREKGLNIALVAVRGVFNFHEKNSFRMSAQTEQQLLDLGVHIVSGAHVLSGAERGLSTKFQGAYPVEIIAHTLRMFGQGAKVCVECATMALDAGIIPYGKPVVAMGGTGSGADTCVLLTPANCHEILQTKIHEIYCKPHL